jgi:hypothetical protein
MSLGSIPQKYVFASINSGGVDSRGEDDDSEGNGDDCEATGSIIVSGIIERSEAATRISSLLLQTIKEIRRKRVIVVPSKLPTKAEKETIIIRACRPRLGDCIFINLFSLPENLAVKLGSLV